MTEVKKVQYTAFGSPKAGTPVTLAAPSIAFDLPLKILTWEDSHRKVGFLQQEDVGVRGAPRRTVGIARGSDAGWFIRSAVFEGDLPLERDERHRD
jgi:hypothetical protein